MESEKGGCCLSHLKADAGLFIAMLAVIGCSQPTAEPVVERPSEGATVSTPRPAAPKIETREVHTPQSGVGTASTTDTERRAAEVAQWQQWYKTARELPDVSMRLQALETWAQRPDDQLDPVTYGLVDSDESVRERAQQLYEQYLAREAAGVNPVGENTSSNDHHSPKATEP